MSKCPYQKRCGPFETGRALLRRRTPRKIHPHYAGNDKESLRLDQVIKADPPEGGMAAYLKDLDKPSRS
jgi:hypothetical protein